MRVVYKPYMAKTLLQAITKAGFLNREIEKLVITREEYDQLREEMGNSSNPPWSDPNKVRTFYGVPLELGS